MAVNGVTVIALEWGIFVPLTTAFILIRYLVRYFWPSKFTPVSNWLVAISYCLFLLAPTLDTVVWLSGFYNDHPPLAAPVSANTTRRGMKVAFSDWVLFYVTLWSIKAAILSVYYQLIPKSSTVYWIALHSLSVLMAATFLAAILLNFLYCLPLNRNWSTDTSHVCFAPFQDTVIIATAALQISTDLAIVILPFPLLHLLATTSPQTRTSTKAGLAAVFAAGVLGVAATSARVAFAFLQPRSLELYTILARTELTVGMFVACSPALRVLATQAGLGRARGDEEYGTARTATTDGSTIFGLTTTVRGGGSTARTSFFAAGGIGGRGPVGAEGPTSTARPGIRRGDSTNDVELQKLPSSQKSGQTNDRLHLHLHHHRLHHKHQHQRSLHANQPPSIEDMYFRATGPPSTDLLDDLDYYYAFSDDELASPSSSSRLRGRSDLPLRAYQRDHDPSDPGNSSAMAIPPRPLSTAQESTGSGSVVANPTRPLSPLEGQRLSVGSSGHPPASRQARRSHLALSSMSSRTLVESALPSPGSRFSWDSEK